MDFDLGGFLGGIIGVAGAYAAAMFQIRKQAEADKPSKNRRIFELCEELTEIINDNWYYAEFEDPAYGGLFRLAGGLRAALISKIPQAIDTDYRISNILADTEKSLHELNTQNLTKAEDYVQMELYKEQLSGCIKEASDKLNEIRNKVLEEIRSKAKQ